MNRWLFNIELPILDSWRTIEVLRTTVLNCLSTVFESGAYCETLGMIVAELLENALKYGRREAAASERSFRLKITGTDDSVEIIVSNPIDRATTDLQRLFAVVGELGASDSAERVYLERLQKVASDRAAVGGLGLARIAYESGSKVFAEVDTDDVLQVKVVTQPGARLPVTGAAAPR
ncbi:MAG: hypothetical protein ACOZIN_01580 [Myxococcota bacterium]